MMDNFTKFTKLYPVNRATTLKVLEIIINQYLPEVGKPISIITDHGTQFKGKRWRDTLLALGIKTYKTSVYHPNSNPAERVLREVGRILRTYCHHQQKKWQEYLLATEEFLNLAPVSYTHLDVYKRQTWDTVCGYWQVELQPQSRQYTAFIFEGRNYQFKRLLFGLVNSCLLYTSRCV